MIDRADCTFIDIERRKILRKEEAKKKAEAEAKKAEEAKTSADG